jgi:hypothetical protein
VSLFANDIVLADLVGMQSSESGPSNGEYDDTLHRYRIINTCM